VSGVDRQTWWLQVFKSINSDAGVFDGFGFLAQGVVPFVFNAQWNFLISFRSLSEPSG
jgi:hypothetical protein